MMDQNIVKKMYINICMYIHIYVNFTEIFIIYLLYRNKQHCKSTILQLEKTFEKNMYIRCK